MLFSILSRLRYGRLEIVAPGGQSFSFPGALPGPDATLELQDWEVCGEILRRGDIGFAETYLAGRWTTADLTAVLSVAALNTGALEEAIYGRFWSKVFYRLRHLLRVNTRGGSQRNIHAHYDLGNDFYRHWLDATMTYSSALFAGDLTRSLEDAQVAKYERILALVDPRPGSRILEIGCGWGGFAEYAARTRRLQRARDHHLAPPARVRAAAYPRRRAQRARRPRVSRLSRPAGQLRPRRVDRDVRSGRRALLADVLPYPAGALEARRAARWSRPSPSPTSASIATAAAPISSSSSSSRAACWRRRRCSAAQAQRAGLAVRSTHAFGLDYAETLRRWNQRFNQAWREIQAEGFDERFKRLWNFYLSYCEAGFRSRSTDVLQVEMSAIACRRCSLPLADPGMLPPGYDRSHRRTITLPEPRA